MIKVMVVDDSPFMRKILTDIIQEDEEIIVVGEARNGKEALEKIPLLKPDLITLDVEMPIMDGMTTLKHIINDYEIPVMMISSLTMEGATLTLEALEEGAIDFIPKPKNIFNLSKSVIKFEIIDKIKAAARSKTIIKCRPKTIVAKKTRPIVTRNVGFEYIVVIATSTGGPRALQYVLPLIPENINASIVVVQHMPPNFTKSLADRLNTLSNIKVTEGKEGEILKPGHCYIAPGDYHMLVKEKRDNFVIELNQEPAIKGLRPAADVLIESVAQLNNIKKVVTIMTGMGSDGSQGILHLKNKDKYIIAQDKETSVVFGMPKSAIETNLVDKIVPLDSIAQEIINIVGV